MIKNFKDWQLFENQTKQSQFLTIKEEIEQWLEDNVSIKGEYIINDDMTINVNGGVMVKYSSESIKSFEVKFNKVTDHFICEDCNLLESLEGAPEIVDGYFDCSNCPSLKSLKGAPETVGGYFDCAFCTSLTSLEGISTKIKGEIRLEDTPVSDFEEELNDNKELLPLYSIGFTKDNYKEPEMQEKLKKLGTEHKVSWSILDSYILDKNVGGSRRLMAKLKKGF
jgi:hypothetical protein